jgi:hypothetical protein
VHARGQQWFSLDVAALDTIRAAIRGLEPFPAPDSWVTAGNGDRTPSRYQLLSAAVLLVAMAAAAVVARRYGTLRPTPHVGGA